MIIVRLKKNRERPILHGHPWVFSGAIAEWEGPRDRPDAADIVAADGTWLARGWAHPSAALAVRVLTRDESEILDEDFVANRLDRAIELRERLFGAPGVDGDTDAYRLFFSEADGLSGLIVDRYADTLAVRVGAAAWAPWLPFIRAHLSARTGIARFHFAAEPDAVEREGLSPAAIAAESRYAPDIAQIRESGFRFAVDVAGGQKTGFYLDQREARRRVAAYAAGADVLSAYCYTGAFELHAAAAGARSILGLDTSAPALERARAHHEMNGLRTPIEYRVADVPIALRKFRDEARSFDLIVLDPPRFVNYESQLEKGLRAYKDINLLALKLLRPGGVVATFSCSAWVKAHDLRLAILWAAADAGREVQILESLSQPADHPILLTFPEGEYLHGLIARAV